MAGAGGDMGGDRGDLTPRREVRTGQTAPPFLRAPQQSLGRSSSMLPSRVGATGACVGFFFFFFVMSYSMWDLSSPPWDGILAPALGAQSRNHWTTGEVPSCVGLSGSVPSPSHECLNVLTRAHARAHTHRGKLEDLEKSQVTFVEWMNFHMSWNLAD